MRDKQARFWLIIRIDMKLIITELRLGYEFEQREVNYLGTEGELHRCSNIIRDAAVDLFTLVN